MDLNERKKQILKSIIDAYIDSGEPVGSKFLTQFGHISLSPATIRNEMSELEDMGYLDKPHTSAGRIPSNTAYRLYIDKLMESYRLTLEELEILNDILRFKMSELDKIIGEAGKIMSDVTKYASLAMTSKTNTECISRFDALLIDRQSFLLVMISDSNSVKTRLIQTTYYLDETALLLIKSALNENLTGIPLDSVALPTIIKTEEQMGRFRSLVSPILRVAYEAVGEETTSSVKIEGLTNLLSYPEFNDVGKIRELMGLFEQGHNYMKTLLSNPSFENNKLLKVYIGEESSMSVLSDTSLVFCSLPVGNTTAILGILGPKRMDYKKVFSSLKQFSENMEKVANIEKPPDRE